MRHLLVLVLLVAFAAQTFNRSVIVLNYYANTAAYAENCENIPRPELKCNGKCQMMKELEAAAKKEKQTPDHKAENKTELLVYYAYATPPVVHLSADEIKYPSYQVAATIAWSASVFHPPAVG